MSIQTTTGSADVKGSRFAGGPFMLGRVLLPLDGSARAERILPYFRQLWRTEETEIILLTVVQSLGLTEGYLVNDPEGFMEPAQRYVEEMKRELTASGLRVRSVVEQGFPVQSILEVAQREKVSLIGMTSHGRTGLPRWLYGSVAEGVLRESQVPLLVVRSLESGLQGTSERGDAPPSLGSVLVPVDGSALASRVLPLVVDLVRRHDCKVSLIHVVEPEGSVGDDDEEAQKTLQEAGQWLLRQGVSCAMLKRTGDPAMEVLKTAHQSPIDLVVMASHGRSGLSRMFLGSVTEEVLRHCPVPVLVVRQ